MQNNKCLFLQVNMHVLYFGSITMRKNPFILLVSLLLLCSSANAQFAKALTQNNPAASNSEATYNVGLIGGMNVTRWFDWGRDFDQYEQPVFLFEKDAIMPSILNHGLAGIVVERKLGENNSVGIEALYANRWTMFSYDYTYTEPVDHEQTDRDNPSYHLVRNYHFQDSILYHEINIQVPLTHYFLGSESKVRPFVYVAPRFSLPLSGNKFWKKQHQGNTDYGIDTIPRQFMRSWNIGALAGAGVQFRVDLPNYYLLLRLDASCQFGILKEPVSEGRRHIGDAAARFTLLFPLKKVEKGACLNWGEYD